MTTPGNRPRWWRTLTAVGFCAVVVAVIVACAVVASHTGMTICGRTDSCDNVGDAAGMAVLAVGIILAVIVAVVVYAGLMSRIERRVIGAKDAARLSCRSGDPRRRGRSRRRKTR